MSTYEKLAIILAGIALLPAIGYPVFNEIRRWCDRKPKIKVHLSYDRITNLYQGNPSLLTISVRNIGEKISIINSVNLNLCRTNKNLFLSNPRSEYPFPYELGPGVCYVCWVKKEDLTKGIADITQWDKKRIKAKIGDMAKWNYESKPFVLDLSKLG